jgi:hypothetical protein
MKDSIKYPKQAKTLLDLLEKDQADLKQLAKVHYSKVPRSQYIELDNAYNSRSAEREKQMLAILSEVKSPTIANIGSQASEAIAVIALHSDLETMKTVLKRFKASNTDYVLSVIPALEDKVNIFEGRTQKFGTQWLEGEDGKPFLYPIEDFSKVNDLRKGYGLDALKWPRIMVEHSNTPTPIKKVSVNDQRLPTEKELRRFKGEIEYE